MGSESGRDVARHGGVKQIQSPPPREDRSRRRGASPVAANPLVPYSERKGQR